jgi:tRNA 2-thiocytidine biosynthesis protein TtcA
MLRPLAYAVVKAFPIIPCDLCGSQENLQRQQIKAMLSD